MTSGPLQRLRDSIAEKTRALVAERQDVSTLETGRDLACGFAIAMEASGGVVPITTRDALREGTERFEKEIRDRRDGAAVARFQKRAKCYLRVMESLVRVDDDKENSFRKSRSSNIRDWKTNTFEVLPSGRRATKRVEGVRATDEFLVDREQAEILDQFEVEERGRDAPMVIGTVMTCACGRPMVVVIDGALLGCPVCRTVERNQSRLSTSLAKISVRAVRASKSPGSSADIQSCQSESRVRELMLSIQGLGPQATPEEATATAEWMLASGRHPLEKHRAKILDALHRREGRLWGSWEEAKMSLGDEVMADLAEINGPAVREHRALMKRAGARIKSYDDCQSIATMMTGLAPPKIRTPLREYVCALLRQAHPVYEAASKNGDNFWGGYPYFLRCVFLLLGRDEYLPYINLPSLKNKEEVRRWLWNAIGWEFVPAEPGTSPPDVNFVGEPLVPRKAVPTTQHGGADEAKAKRFVFTSSWMTLLRSGKRARVSVK